MMDSEITTPRPTYGLRQRIPWNMTLDRTWRWCVLATLRDLRTHAQTGVAISWPNARRLLTRRWNETCCLFDMPADSADHADLLQVATLVLRDGYFKALRRNESSLCAA